MWPPPDARLFSGKAVDLAALPIDHSVVPAPLKGGEMPLAPGHGDLCGSEAGSVCGGAKPSPGGTPPRACPLTCTSGTCRPTRSLTRSPSEGVVLGAPNHEGHGGRSGWWGMSASAEAFVDQLVTWRELGFNAAVHLSRYDRYASLPDWSCRTLEKHAHDRRTHLYAMEQLEGARTHDDLWNAAQRQLVREGADP